jgi:Lon protease-like protein
LLRAADAEAGSSAAIQLPADALIIVPVRGFVLFPGTVFPVAVARPKSIKAAQQAVREQRQIGILMQRDPEVAEPGPLDLHRVGTVANLVRYVTAPDGSHHLVCQGEQRFRVLDFVGGFPFLAARVNRIEEPEVRTPEIEARFLNLQRQAIEALELLPQEPQELIAAVQRSGHEYGVFGPRPALCRQGLFRRYCNGIIAALYNPGHRAIPVGAKPQRKPQAGFHHAAHQSAHPAGLRDQHADRDRPGHERRDVSLDPPDGREASWLESGGAVDQGRRCPRW